MAADVLEQIVVRVHAIQRRVRRMGLVQVTEQIVDEVGKGLGSNHRFGACVRAGRTSWVHEHRSVNGTINAALHMPGTLFVVATPIGNLEDITVRALRILREVAVIAAEDTRRTAHLLARHAIATPTTSLHEHNEARKSPALDRAACSAGEHIALVSDAGTPTVSDPGGHLIRAGHRRRDPRRADSRVRAPSWPPWRRPGFRRTRFRSWAFPQLGRKTENVVRTRSRTWAERSFSSRHPIGFARRSPSLQRAVGDCQVVDWA